MSGAASDVELLASAVPSSSRALVLGDGAELARALARRDVTAEVVSVDDPGPTGGPFDAAVVASPIGIGPSPDELVATLAAAAGAQGRVVLVADDAAFLALHDDLEPPDRRPPTAERAARARTCWPAITEVLEAAGLTVWWHLGIADADFETQAGDSDLLDAVLGPPSRRAARHLVVAGNGPAPRAEVPLVADLAERLTVAEHDRDDALDRLVSLEQRLDIAESVSARIDDLERGLVQARRELRAHEERAQVVEEYVGELEWTIETSPLPECDFREHLRRVLRNRTRRYIDAAARAVGLRRGRANGAG